MSWVTGLCAVFSSSFLLVILGYIAYRGLSAVNWAFLTRLPKPVGEVGGGIANAIVGSVKVVGLAGLIGIPVGVLAGIYLSEFGRGKAAFWVRYAADVLNGVPTIVTGIFVYALLVVPLKRFSALSGSVALAIILVPIVLRSTEEFLRLVPNPIREGALALGLPRWKVTLFVVVPTAASGIATGCLLGLSRVAGETAPLLFTAFGNRNWDHGLLEPIASLPLTIFNYAISPYDDWHRQAWAAALVLMAFVLAVNVATRLWLKTPAGASH
ncbi:MAG: phosphate ABC transporter permease PstA [Elusimicrobia bacterium]|nr:phosphate ABC transporter permease PstA [Elusimicrobiota bacterium]